MISFIARITTTAARKVLIASAVFIVVAGAIGALVIPRMSGGGYSDPGSDSAAVTELMSQEFDVEVPHLTLIMGEPDRANAVEDLDVARKAVSVLRTLEDVEGVSRIDSYWSLGQPVALRSGDGSLALALIYIEADSLDQQNEIAQDVIAATPTESNGLSIFAGGTGAIYTGINGQITEDIKFAETISIPLTLLLLLIVFGTAIAAGMPVIVGLGAISGALFVVYLVSLFTDVSVFALNLITGLGLGLGIDYSLLIVNRFREELARGSEALEAVAATVRTAGKTVLVSGLTVAVTLASLSVFPQPFLRSFAYAGVAVCLTAVLGALIPLPAALALLGHRIDSWRVRKGSLAPSDDGLWSRVARFVMRKPFVITGVTLVALIALALPAFTAKFSQVDDRVLPADHPAAIAAATYRSEFGESQPIDVVFEKSISSAQVAEYASAASSISGVIRVETQKGIYSKGTFVSLEENPGWPGQTLETSDWQRIVVATDISARTPAAEDLVNELRALDASALVGGAAGEYSDSQEGIARQLPWALLWVAVATLILLFLFTGSVLLPIKAVVLNVLSLGATMGVITWMFQNGNLQFLTGDYTVTGTLDTSTLVLIAIVTFGLSMDYEVFLLSRVKEEHDAGSDTTDAVALGLQRSGRIISAAAVLLAVVFAAFVTSSVTSIKMLGFGIAFAILLDATVVRGLLVPALMRIAGRFNWWAPAPLVKLHQRIGLSD